MTKGDSITNQPERLHAFIPEAWGDDPSDFGDDVVERMGGKRVGPWVKCEEGDPEYAPLADGSYWYCMATRT